jgi:PTS system mannose-specific IIA component
VIGILIIAHGTLGESLIHCVSHVMGDRPLLLNQLGVGVHDDPVSLLPQAQTLLRDLDQGGGVLVLSDIYGATPCNLAGKLLEPGRVEGISGVNLPMLVRAIAYRNERLDVLVDKAVAGGQSGVVHFTQEACADHD